MSDEAREGDKEKGQREDRREMGDDRRMRMRRRRRDEIIIDDGRTVEQVISEIKEKKSKKMAEMPKFKLFGKYEMENISIPDPSMEQFISFKPLVIPHTHGRHAKRMFSKREVNIVERLVNKLMRGGTGEKTSGRVIRTHGKLQGKKARAIRIVEEAFDRINTQTKENPVQVMVNAIGNTAPREDTTRVAYGGVFYQVAVDVSSSRRVDMALRNIALATIMGSFGKKKTMAEALADEIILAAKADVNSYAVKKKEETERMAQSAR